MLVVYLSGLTSSIAIDVSFYGLVFSLLKKDRDERERDLLDDALREKPVTP